jgi:hypothetical protein
LRSIDVLCQAGDLATTGTVEPTYDSGCLLHALLRKDAAAATPRRYHVLYLAGRPVAQLAAETGQPDRWWYLTTDHLGVLLHLPWTDSGFGGKRGQVVLFTLSTASATTAPRSARSPA